MALWYSETYADPIRLSLKVDRVPRGWHGDAGNPEGLADRIVCWEAWAHHHGWRVDTPRIPGLAYPTWSELEAEWA